MMPPKMENVRAVKIRLVRMSLNLALFALFWCGLLFFVYRPLQVDTMSATRGRGHHSKTSPSSWASKHHLPLRWTSSTQIVSVAFQSTASWTNMEIFLTPAKIHRLDKWCVLAYGKQLNS